MSQATLAAEMTGKGFSWHQQTVARMENGTRRADLGEAVALTEIFGVGLDTLLPPEAVAL